MIHSQLNAEVVNRKEEHILASSMHWCDAEDDDKAPYQRSHGQGRTVHVIEGGEAAHRKLTVLSCVDSIEKND